MHAAFEWLPVGVLLAGADGAIVMANRELERIFGYERAELIGQTVDALVPDASRTTHAELRHGFAQNPHARRMAVGREVFGRRKDGSEVPLEVGLTPVRIRGALLTLVSVTDLTEQRRLQRDAQTVLDERIDFEMLIGELGAEFVNLRPDDLRHHIEEALGRVVRTLDLDRSGLFIVDDDGDFVHTHQWTRPGWAPPPPRVSARQQFPWLLSRIRAGEVALFSSIDEVPEPTDRESLRQMGTQSSVIVPLTVGGRVWGAVSFATVRQPRTWTPVLVTRLQVVAVIFANALARKQGDDALKRALADTDAVRDRLRDENAYLRQELRTLTGASVFVGYSPAMRRLLEQIRTVASTDTPVLLLGETGTGKSLLASRIHELSTRSERPLVRVDCAALSATSIDTELFGTARGSYEGTGSRQTGRLELADRSTVFLDDIADLPMDAQAALTRVLQDRQIHPVGSASPVKIDVRVIAATSRDLLRHVAQGRFREDLYYQLSVFPVQVPPLRERPEDIPLLVWRFVDEFSEVYRKPIDTIDDASMAALRRYAWPGNARELRNVVERAMIVATGRRLTLAPHPPAAGASRKKPPQRRGRRA